MTDDRSNDLREQLTQRANYLNNYQPLLLRVHKRLSNRQLPTGKDSHDFKNIVKDYKRRFYLSTDLEAVQDIREYCKSVQAAYNSNKAKDVTPKNEQKY